MSDWQVVESALDMASVMGVLSLCTCDEPLVKWRDDVCGHCQLGPEFVCRDGPVFTFERMRAAFGLREV